MQRVAITGSTASAFAARTDQNDGGGGCGQRVRRRRPDHPRGEPCQQHQIHKLQVPFVLFFPDKFWVIYSDLVASHV